MTEPVRFTGRISRPTPKGASAPRSSTDGGRPPHRSVTLENAVATAAAPTATKQRLTWTGVDDLSSLRGRPVRFRFTVDTGELFRLLGESGREGDEPRLRPLEVARALQGRGMSEG